MKRVGRVPLAELKQAGRLRLKYPPFDVCVVYVDGSVYAIEDACNHAGASLCEGDVQGDNMSCPMHGYIFSLKSGQLVAPKGLCDDQRTFRVTLDGETVVVDDDFELEIK